MSNNRLSFRISNFLFNHMYFVYNLIYPIFKKIQDKEEIHFLKSTIQPNTTVVDIGANIGVYAKIIANIVGQKGKVIAFEPDKINYERLVKNTIDFPNIINHLKAISDKTHTLKLYKSPLLNVDHRTYQVDDATEIVEIDAISLDDFIDNKYPINFIKMDIQGYEYSAFLGMINTLKNNPKIIILTEYWPYGLHKANTDIDAYFNLFKSIDFKVYKLVGSSIEPFTEKDKAIDQINNFNYYSNIVIKK